jgi:hypothetical protein
VQPLLFIDACLHRTPLWYAIEEKERYVVKRLIESKADVNKECRKPRTYPLLQSFFVGVPEIQRLLLDAKASVECTNWQESNILHAAIDNNPADKNDPIHFVLSSAYHLLFRVTNSNTLPFEGMLRYNKPMAELYRHVMTTHLVNLIEMHVPDCALVDIIISLYFPLENIF